MRVLRHELPSAFTNHSLESTPRKGATEKLKVVKARINFEEASQYSESGTPSRRRSLKERLGSRHAATCPKALNQGVASLSHHGKEKKCIKDPVEIHNIKQRDGESIEKFMRRYKLKCKDVKGAPECMKISGFMNRITNPELIKRKQQDAGQKLNFKKRGFQSQQRLERKQDRFTLLTKTPKEILALDKGKFKPPSPMTTLVEKRNASKLYEFHGEVGHTTDECMHLKRKIEEMLKVGKLSHLIKELKQSSGKYQAKPAKKGETSGKDKPLAILMVQPWQRVAKQKITQTFSPKSVISVLPLREEDKTEGPMIIEAEMRGHFVHRMYVDGGCLPIRQKKRGQAPKRSKAIYEEVEKLVDAVFERRAKINGKLASLNRFLSKSAEKSLPFFKTLKKCTKKSDFRWTSEAEMAFRQMKKSIAELPMLIAPKEKEELIIYLAAAKETISAILMTERDGKQIPVYFFSHALQDFIMKRLEDDFPNTPMKDKKELPDPWILFTDGSSCTDSSGARLILTNPEGMEFTYSLGFRFEATNNKAEYEALIVGLRIPEQIGAKNLQAHVDSWLVANQVNGSYVAKELGMIQYLEKVRALTSTFKEFSIKQVPRGENKKADALRKILSTSFAHLSKQVLVEELKENSIDEKEVLAVVEEGCTWMTPIHEYLTEGILPDEKKKARAVRRKAGRYAVTNEVLYKRSFLGP
uniref:Reverse transcriptase domain-containing protein n=1 Tax=Tanacetum cinerariifolium TaxID=118510 RepID=A0A699GVR4_TANCI|nr:reverse transcriptase domain-containing protein [Tanacetum cinerariifolium]